MVDIQREVIESLQLLIRKQSVTNESHQGVRAQVRSDSRRMP